MGLFAGKTVLITGASAGIGEALAREFSEEGATVILAARRLRRLQTLEEEIVRSGGQALAVECDVTRDGDLEEAVAAVVERYGCLDVAVANAGYAVLGTAERLDIDDYRRQFETNVFGVLRTLYAARSELKRNQGRLVIVGSIAGHASSPWASAYTMSKFAVRALSEALQGETAMQGMTVTLASPGFVKSEIHKVDRFGKVHEDARDRVPAWLRMPTEKAARQIVRAAHRRQREIVITGHGKLMFFLSKHCRGLLGWWSRRKAR